MPPAKSIGPVESPSAAGVLLMRVKKWCALKAWSRWLFAKAFMG